VSKYFECYYCKSNTFKTDNDFEYQNHVEQTSKQARLPFKKIFSKKLPKKTG